MHSLCHHNNEVTFEFPDFAPKFFKFNFTTENMPPIQPFLLSPGHPPPPPHTHLHFYLYQPAHACIKMFCSSTTDVCKSICHLSSLTSAISISPPVFNRSGNEDLRVNYSRADTIDYPRRVKGHIRINLSTELYN